MPTCYAVTPRQFVGSFNHFGASSSGSLAMFAAIRALLSFSRSVSESTRRPVKQLKLSR